MLRDGTVIKSWRDRLRLKASLRTAGRIANNPLFDPEWYLTRYCDVRETGMDPRIHYWNHGASEGRDPNPVFDTTWYVTEYPDVAKAHINPLDHYLAFGLEERRSPCPPYFAEWLLAQHVAVSDSSVHPMIRHMRRYAGGSVSASDGDALRAGRQVSACTIVARNYLSYARILADSFLRHHPGSNFYLLVVDGLPEGVAAGPGITVIDVGELALPNFPAMSFKYDVTELSTSVKPTLLSLLLGKYDEEAIAYFDPDILIMRPLEEMNRQLSSADILLIPHLLQPIPLDGHRPSEQDILISGAYNLGFIALQRTQETTRFLRWWEERLADHCRKSPGDGLMVDQKWIDLVPGLFPGTRVLRDDTYNIAYWNLNSREIAYQDGTFAANGRPISFFHFSGFDAAHRTSLSKHQDRFAVVTDTPLASLLDIYARLQMAHGFEDTGGLEYGYSRLNSGIRVHPILRSLYAGLPEQERRAFGDPFDDNGHWSLFHWATSHRDHESSPFLERLYQLRPDVAAAFPDLRGKHRTAFIEWARTHGATEERYESAYIEATGSVQDLADNSRIAEGDGTAEEETFGTTGPATVTSHPQPSRIGVNVVGYLRNESGVGAAARAYIRALKAVGSDVAPIDVSELSPNRSHDVSVDLHHDGTLYDVNLVAVNADQHFHVASHLGDDLFRGRYNIGVWQWELPRFPGEWRDRFQHYDEIWVGTSFVVNALAAESPIPVVRVPPPLVPSAVGSRERGRSRFALEDEETLFAFAFDFHSYFERKNPLAIVEAFQQAFASSDRVRLVIKCTNHQFEPEKLKALQRAADDPRIAICTGYWPAEEVADLMAACDAYVSLHRSEGIGLTISHAMALGKPVIATGWSGNMDFMSVANSLPVRYELVRLDEDIGPYRAGETWAEPSVEHAAELMRWVHQNGEAAAGVGERAASDISSLFSEESTAKIARERLKAIRDSQGARGATSDFAGPERRGEDEVVVADGLRELRASVERGEQRLSQLEAAIDQVGRAARRVDARTRNAAQQARRQAVSAIKPLLHEIGLEVEAVRSSVDRNDIRAEELAGALADVRQEVSAVARELEERESDLASRFAELQQSLTVASSDLAVASQEAKDLGTAKFAVEAALSEQAGRISDTAAQVKRLEGRFAARPYMAFDAFGALGDREQPMGYRNESGSRRKRHPRFEDIFRGSEEFIADRQRTYLQFFSPGSTVIDLGCGRGEFLGLLTETGVNAVGVELDEELVRRCTKRGLQAIKGDALDYLRTVEPGTLDGIFSAQMIEHLDPVVLRELLSLAKQSLHEGGTLVAETVNPESFEALKTFHVDLTHQKPIYPQVLLFLCREAGFRRARIFYPHAGGFTQGGTDIAGEYAVVATV